MQKPQTYEKETELYYLSWVEHGKPGQRALVALKLLDVEGKTQYGLTEKLWKCESEDLIKHALLLSLFDQRPELNVQAVEKLLTKENPSAMRGTPGERRTGDEMTLQSLETGNPKPYDEYLKEGPVDYYFDWGHTAAVRLVKNGFLSDPAFEGVLQVASTELTYLSRKEAKEAFDCFDGIPVYDPGSKEELRDSLNDPFGGWNKYQEKQLKQIRSIRKWYEANKSKLKWDKSKRKYIISS